MVVARPVVHYKLAAIERWLPSCFVRSRPQQPALFRSTDHPARDARELHETEPSSPGEVACRRWPYPARCCVISSSYVRPLRNIWTRTGAGAATTACTPFTPIASTGCRYSIQPQYGLQAVLLHDEKDSPFLCGMSYANRTTHGSTNHFLRAAGPAFVKAWIFDQDGQVVAASVMAALRARWTSRDVIPANLPHRPNVLQNAKF